MKNVVKQHKIGDWKLVIKVADHNGSISVDSRFDKEDRILLSAKGLSAWGMLAIVRTACSLIGASDVVKDLCKEAILEAEVHGCREMYWNEKIDEIQ